MTGLRPSTTGIYGLAPWFRDVESLSDLVSLPQHLAKHGYTTYTTGKIYHGGYGRRPRDQEWDVIGTPAGVGAKPPKKLVNTPAKHPLVDWGVFPHDDRDKGDWKVASWAVEQLDQRPQEPFFLTCGFFLPHVPCYATQKWFDLYPVDQLLMPPYQAGDRDDTPRFSWYLHWKLPEPRMDFLQQSNQWANLVRSYLACTSFVDSQVGRVLDALERNGFAEDTIVVLWSDHGWHLGEKQITGKNSLWDRSTRVPLIFAGPKIAAGAKCDQPVELLDMYPTLSELAEIPPNERVEGISLKPWLGNAKLKRERPAITTHNHDNHGIRTENWRYIVYADGSEELYDMRVDANEWNNLAQDPAHQEMLTRMRKWIPKSQPPAPGSRHRILTRAEDGTVVWEGLQIKPGDPIPEVGP